MTGNQNAVDSLRESIRLLEIRQAEEEKILKEQLRLSYDSLKPVNLIKSTIRDVSSSLEIRSGLWEIIISILSGYFTKKMIVRSERNILMKIVGTVLQFGMAGFVSKNIESIRDHINQLFDKIRIFAQDKVPNTQEEKVIQSE